MSGASPSTRKKISALLLLMILSCAAIAEYQRLQGKTVPYAGLRRSRRTLDRMCGNEQFVNALARTLIDESRPLLAATEPLVLGDGPDLGEVRLINGRLWGAASLHLRDRIRMRCDSARMAVSLHVALNNSRLAYYWKVLDGNLGSGSATFFWREMALKFVVVMPRKWPSGGPVQVFALRITTLRGAEVELTGPWPVAHGLSIIANMFLDSMPDWIPEILSRPLKNGLQLYLDRLFVELQR